MAELSERFHEEGGELYVKQVANPNVLASV
jgi:hypothetical protein